MNPQDQTPLRPQACWWCSHPMCTLPWRCYHRCCCPCCSRIALGFLREWKLKGLHWWSLSHPKKHWIGKTVETVGLDWIGNYWSGKLHPFFFSTVSSQLLCLQPPVGKSCPAWATAWKQAKWMSNKKRIFKASPQRPIFPKLVGPLTVNQKTGTNTSWNSQKMGLAPGIIQEKGIYITKSNKYNVHLAENAWIHRITMNNHLQLSTIFISSIPLLIDDFNPLANKRSGSAQSLPALNFKI